MIESSRILLVDDDGTALKLMKELLTGRSYMVDTAESVDKAEKMLGETIYGALVTDSLSDLHPRSAFSWPI